jgi:hypothetical protein
MALLRLYPDEPLPAAVRLFNVHGITTQAGTDADGHQWVSFVLNRAADWPAECRVCGAETWEGWGCVFNGDAVCVDHADLVQ